MCLCVSACLCVGESARVCVCLCVGLTLCMSVLAWADVESMAALVVCNDVSVPLIALPLHNFVIRISSPALSNIPFFHPLPWMPSPASLQPVTLLPPPVPRSFSPPKSACGLWVLWRVAAEDDILCYNTSL